uniref:DNA topoisomerase n=1 Tax=Parascaris univalens TaxID=6257 RepID=A0A914ZRB8_PARUN
PIRRVFLQVGTSSSQSVFTCLPSVNYCQCAFFQENVLRKQNSYSCQHVMAIWIAERIGKVGKRIVTSQTIALTIKQLSSYAYDFN